MKVIIAGSINLENPSQVREMLESARPRLFLYRIEVIEPGRPAPDLPCPTVYVKPDAPADPADIPRIRCSIVARRAP